MLHRIIKILSFICLTLILAVSGVLGWHFFSAQAAPTELAGWYWSENYGWISLSSGNGNAGTSDVEYSVKISIKGDLSGWGWSSNVGWVCFGETCSSNKICGTLLNPPCDPQSFGTYLPNGQSWVANIDLYTHKITGWAKIISLKDRGLIHLGMGQLVEPATGGVQCYDCIDECIQWTMSGEPLVPGPPCVEFKKDCNTCFTRTIFDGNNISIINNDPALNDAYVVGGSGNICSECISCNNISSANGEGSRVACDSCVSCNLYGGANSITDGSVGWGWNGNDNGNGVLDKDGAGWIQFNPNFGGSGGVYSWLQTQYGTVYSKNNIKQQSVTYGGYNATYCIIADSVANFNSQNCDTNVTGVNLDFPSQTDSDSVYKNALGKIDIKGLTTVVNNAGGQNYNKYGNIVEVIGNDWSGNKILDNKVYVLQNGDLFVDGLNINNGVSGSRGNGIVIVMNGNLIINNNIAYGSGDLTDLKQLASVAWIVRGDIKIQLGVTQAAGAFIVLGNGTAECQIDPSSNSNYPKYQLNKCGVFASGISATNPLTIFGLVMAKAFNFERTYADLSQGSENIIYDGRLSANPPPGMKSLIEGLPIIRDF